ncbi:MAG: fused MFS/spermidine synthase [Candidatus Wallbacteria bacterium]|nr:fused MFS/spermidine synthase [Candidatus Wallbacteria bacterium]
MNFLIRFSVFISGCAVMIVEIAAVRSLAPYFGNTVYCWTSVIGVMLAAMSIGYWAGGLLADRFNKPGTFFSALAASGLLISLIPVLSHPVLQKWQYSLGVRTGPTVSACVFLALPALLCAMFPPFAVSALTVKDLPGKAAGSVFAVSAIGSIAGTFLTGFVLIPLFGLSKIYAITGAILFLTGASGVLCCGKKFLLLHVLILTPAGLFCAFNFRTPALGDMILFHKDSAYQQVQVGRSNDHSIIWLFLDNTVHSGRWVKQDGPLFSYENNWKLAWLLKPDTSKVLVAGAGGFSIPRAILDLHPEAQVETVDIDPVLEETGKKFFQLDQYPQLIRHYQDARSFLTQAKQFDLIFVDVFLGKYGIPFHFCTKEFFHTVKSALSPGGVMMMNLTSAVRGPDSALYRALHSTACTVFPRIVSVAMNPDAFEEEQNILLLASAETELGRDFFLSREEKIMELGLAGICAKLTEPDQPGLILTDDYAPVENLLIMPR